MRSIRGWSSFALAVVVLSAVAFEAVAQTARSTVVPLKYDQKTKLHTADLGGIPAGATIFRADLLIRDAAQPERRPTRPTKVYADGSPGKPFALVPPYFRTLDALDAVKAALAAGKPLAVRAEVLAGKLGGLSVSFLGGRRKATDLPVVTNVKAVHRGGQTLITFTEPKLETLPDFATEADVKAFRDAFAARHKDVAFRIWRSGRPITPKTVAAAKLVGECGFFTAWNATYHQQRGRGKGKPLRYRVTDAAEPVAWGTGIYAHNPAKAGKAYYAVTVAVNGEEDLAKLAAANTAGPVNETVGLGEPVLQWIEELPQKTRWLYRHGPMVRLIYTRWEAPPHSSVPNNPIDYLVVIPQGKRPEGTVREPQYKSFRVDPAPVGLHMHGWGGNLNGGYGWWYNGHKGAVLIASNQIPYDWWTGYHEASGTCKTLGDGVVVPYTMNRLLGFVDWAKTQHQHAPEAIRPFWPKLDLTRLFTAGNSMGGSGSAMYPIRFGPRVAYCISWVGVHVPELSPQFAGSYRHGYGPRHEAVTVADGKTSPWDWFSDAWWLRKFPAAETGWIVASNGKNDGGIGWKQAYLFARALQETRRPHLFNWGLAGHGTHTLIGANVPLDVRTDQSLPAFTNGSLDENIGTGTRRPKAEIEADRARQLAEQKAGKRQHIHVDPYDGDSVGAYNAQLRWRTDDVLDTAAAWEMTVYLLANAPADECTVDLTPRRLQTFATPAGRTFRYTVSAREGGKLLKEGSATADALGLLTLRQIPVTKSAVRVKITPAR